MSLFIAAHHAAMAVLRLARADAGGTRPADTPHHCGLAKAACCARLIGRARWRARLQLHDARLGALLAEAGERLDELDELLLRCHPVSHAAMFAAAARLHRELECIQASVSSARRRGSSAWQADAVAVRGGGRAEGQPRPPRGSRDAGVPAATGVRSGWQRRDGARNTGERR
jgi:hypothetical protein